MYRYRIVIEPKAIEPETMPLFNPYDREGRQKLMDYCEALSVHNHENGLYDVRGTILMGYIDIWTGPWKSRAARFLGCLCWFYNSVWSYGNIKMLQAVLVKQSPNGQGDQHDS